MATDPLQPRPRPPACRRRARRLARGASVVGLTVLSACASGAPPGPLVAGGQLAAGLAALRPSEPLSTELWPAPAVVPVATPASGSEAPLPALRPAPMAPPPSPRKPTLEPRVVWVPRLKPPPRTALAAASAPPTIRPAPRKPDDVAIIEPAAGPSDAVVTMPEPEPIIIARGLREWPRLAATVSVAEPDSLLPQLDRAAREALLAGDATTALQLYQRASELFPSDRSALLGRALALQQLGRQREAQALYQVLLEEDASDLGARIALLGVLAERAPDEALRLLRRLARYHPDDARLPAQTAMTLARLGALDAAIAEQRRAVTLAPTNLGHQINLAVLHDRAGHPGEAALAYRRALELAMLTGAPSAQIGQVAARLQHLRALQQPRQVPAQAPR